jgi:hypothetical protein
MIFASYSFLELTNRQVENNIYLSNTTEKPKNQKIVFTVIKFSPPRGQTRENNRKKMTMMGIWE